jgi:uncharacterized protein with GYD domain
VGRNRGISSADWRPSIERRQPGWGVGWPEDCCPASLSVAGERDIMPTYLVLYRFTEKGRLNMRETVRRASEIQKENEDRGFRILAHYWTQGQYDLVSLVEAPSEEAMLGGLFNIASAGNVVSETLRAFSDEEMQRALA